ncbi:YIP1 family protein [Candidatus Palauibacter polyketidifaciens]|uniref:YIP1 family protein n=1 Tax=Candidatus Palauibacter polyketidifaciens TaxID=3056740 RepID=UPI0023916B6B|nr:YIP1 family protein [Candidatus Palauibacter polyketidifaciens]MDE2721422.1 YIP1 family protein [Candidatus Palauibacter polyketidifaciens]
MEHLPESSEASVEEHAIPSLPVRIVQVFVSPAALFDALRQRPAWMGATLALIGLSIALQFLTPVIVPEEVLRRAAEARIADFIPAGADPEVLEQQVDAAVTPGVGVVVGTIIMTPLVLSLIAGLLLIAFNVMLGGEASFKQLLSAAAHAMYIGTAGGLVSIGLMAVGAEIVTLSPGLFLPEMEGFIGRFLNGINVFSVWTCGVLGVAVSRFYPGRSVAAGTTYLLVLYLIFVAAVAVFAGLLAGLAG